MIFTGFKRKSNQIFFNKRASDLLENSKKEYSGKVKKVLVLLDTIFEKSKIQQALLDMFKNTESDIEFVVIQPRIKKNQESENIITPKDFGWYGKINSEKLKSILTIKYDLLINYSKVDNVYHKLLLLHCDEVFTVGFKHYVDNRFYDLIINCEPTDLTMFNAEIKKYLTILNKIE